MRGRERHTNTQTHKHTNTHMWKHTHTHTHTHTHRHTHTSSSRRVDSDGHVARGESRVPCALSSRVRGCGGGGCDVLLTRTVGGGGSVLRKTQRGKCEQIHVGFKNAQLGWRQKMRRQMRSHGWTGRLHYVRDCVGLYVRLLPARLYRALVTGVEWRVRSEGKCACTAGRVG